MVSHCWMVFTSNKRAWMTSSVSAGFEKNKSMWCPACLMMMAGRESDRVVVTPPVDQGSNSPLENTGCKHSRGAHSKRHGTRVG